MLAVLVLSAPADAATTRNGNVAHACEVSGSWTLARSSTARVFRARDRTYGCLFRYGRRYRLDEPLAGGEPPRLEAPIDLSGRFVGFAVTNVNVEPPDHEVTVVDLASGKVHRQPKTPSYGFEVVSRRDSGVKDLEINARGSVAWITFDPFVGEYEVFKADSESDKISPSLPALPDSGKTVGRTSLRLSAERLSWVRADRRRTAVLR